MDGARGLPRTKKINSLGSGRSVHKDESASRTKNRICNYSEPINLPDDRPPRETLRPARSAARGASGARDFAQRPAPLRTAGDPGFCQAARHRSNPVLEKSTDLPKAPECLTYNSVFVGV